MLRAFGFLIVAVILLALAWAIGSIPGTLTAHSGGYMVQTSVPAAIVMMAVIALVLALLLRLFGGIRRAPGGFGNWRSGRRRRLGEAATERGIVALAAGDAAAAQTEAVNARRLLGDTPLVLLLTAESARLAGKPEQANAAFQQLTQHKRMAYLGHRGLLRHHLAAGDSDTAAGHALAAEDAYPGGAWTKDQRLEIALRKRDYAAALNLARNPAQTVALATAAANAATSPADALIFAKRAIKTAPGFAPAIAAYANALRRAKRDRAARQTLLKGWAAAPHPLLGDAWLEKIAAPIERAQAAVELADSAPRHPESELLLAQTALAAQLSGEAKRHAHAALAAGLKDKRVYAILASLEPGPDSIAAAANAPAAKWRCEQCQAETEDWTAICPNCGKAGTLAWQSSNLAPAAPTFARLSA
jgi:HemY protein